MADLFDVGRCAVVAVGVGAGKYVAHGAKAFQIDMPSKDPFSETDFVKELMKNSLIDDSSYDRYMDGIREIRRRHPQIDLHVVVYDDVVDSIGVEKFIAL